MYSNKMKYFWWLYFIVIGFVSCFEHDLKAFDDSILFGINWPGKPENLEHIMEGEETESQKKEILKVKTTNRETYECHLPVVTVQETKSIEDYDGPSPVHLLKPLFAQKICSYRLESYWSYEICHGRYIRQYHEEREGKKSSIQQYFLGHWSAQRQLKLEDDLKELYKSKDGLITLKVDGKAVPYVEMLLDDGTICDLSGKPRVARVRYVCFVHGKHEVYSFKETSTCEYEVVVLSPLLCEHPLFKPKEVGENIIDCLPVDDAPRKPRNLLKSEVESLEFHHQIIRLHEQEPKDVLAVLKVEKIEKEGETEFKFEIHHISEGDRIADVIQPPQLPEKSLPPVTDDSPVRAFLNGENCLNGGTGWWKYEFCYGKHVVQYHVHRSGEKTTLVLGKFDEQAHLNWIRENKGKVPKKPVDQRTSVSHFFSNGDICDKTGKPRQTEVKLKCLENASSPAQVSLYLLEPRTCHYILGVESPLICDLLPLAEDTGLIKTAKPVLRRQDNVVKTKEDDNEYGETIVKLGND